MRRLLVVAVVLGLLFAGAVASAEEHLPEHPHMLLTGVEVDLSGEEPVLLGVRKCVDLAANQALHLGAHHEHVHFGPAGEALFTHAGHAVVPAAPFPGVPWSDCESLLAFFGLD